MSEATRRVNYLIGGMPVRIAKFGVTDGSKTVGVDACPAIPTSEAPGPWLYLGKIKSGQVEQVKKNVQIEGVNDATGMYETEDVTMVQQYKLKFTTQYIAPEVIQLAFGVADELADNQEAVPFVSNGEIRVWLYGRLTDHAENGKELMEWCVMGRLRLTNTPNFASDPATAEWELSIEYSPLQKLTPKALASPATA